MRFRWKGRPIDFYGLVAVALSVQSSGILDLLAGRELPGIVFVLARATPLLLLSLLVALLTVFCPEQLVGARRPRRSHGSSAEHTGKGGANEPAV
jgi:hypothetical protein